MTPTTSKQLADNCRRDAGRVAWLQRLPGRVAELRRRWALRFDDLPLGDSATCAWVAPVRAADGASAVLKLAMPHMEAEHEIPGLRFWDGDPTVRLLAADEALDAMLLERCEPGTSLRDLPEIEQDVVISGLLRRLWRPPAQGHPFRHLSVLINAWRDETLSDVERWRDAGLVREGLCLMEELSRSAPAEMLLATDLHAGNVLRSQREPWLVIDPKPFVGDTAYDTTQHLLNCVERVRSNPHDTICRLADLLCVDHERVRLWTFARAAADPRDDWDDHDRLALAKALSP